MMTDKPLSQQRASVTGFETRSGYQEGPARFLELYWVCLAPIVPSAGLHRLRLGITTNLPQQGGVVFQTLNHQRIPFLNRFLKDCQRTLVERLGRRVAALVPCRARLGC